MLLLHLFLAQTTPLCTAHYIYTLLIIAGGGYVISPVNQKKQSVVKHMLAIDWRFWKSSLQTSSARYITIHMLGRLAGVFFTVRSSFILANSRSCSHIITAHEGSPVIYCGIYSFEGVFYRKIRRLLAVEFFGGACETRKIASN